MKAKIYLKTNDPKIDDILEIEGIKKNTLKVKSIHLLAATGLFTFCSKDHSRMDMIPRENIQRIEYFFEEGEVPIDEDELVEAMEELTDEDMEEYEINMSEEDEELLFGEIEEELLEEEGEDEEDEG